MGGLPTLLGYTTVGHFIRHPPCPLRGLLCRQPGCAIAPQPPGQAAEPGFSAQRAVGRVQQTAADEQQGAAPAAATTAAVTATTVTATPGEQRGLLLPAAAIKRKCNSSSLAQSGRCRPAATPAPFPLYMHVEKLGLHILPPPLSVGGIVSKGISPEGNFS